LTSCYRINNNDDDSDFVFVCIYCQNTLREVAVLYAVLAQDAIQAALKDYKSKNEGTDEGQAQSSAN